MKTKYEQFILSLITGENKSWWLNEFLPILGTDKSIGARLNSLKHSYICKYLFIIHNALLENGFTPERVHKFLPAVFSLQSWWHTSHCGLWFRLDGHTSIAQDDLLTIAYELLINKERLGGGMTQLRFNKLIKTKSDVIFITELTLSGGIEKLGEVS